jgi:PST family polysaccharide transporter
MHHMNSRRLLTENILSLSLLQMLNYAAPLITVPYLVRTLEPAQFGLLSFGQSIALSLRMLTDYGFGLSATRAIAANHRSAPSIARTFWIITCAKAILMSASALLLLLAVTLIPKLHQTPSIFAASFLYVIGAVAFPVWLFQGLEAMKISAAAFGLARLISIPSLLIFVQKPQDCVKAAAIQAGVESLAGFIGMTLLSRRLRIGYYRPSLQDIVHAFREAWPLFLSGSAFSLSNSSATAILGFFASSAQVGYYSAAEKFIKAAIAALNPMNQALYPHVTAKKSESTRLALALIRRSLLVTTALASLVSIAIFCFAHILCRFVLGPHFSASALVLRYMAPLPLLSGLMSVLGTQTMVVFGMDKLLSTIMLSAAAFGIPLTALLSRLFGVAGAALSSLLMALFVVAFMMVALRARGLAVWQSQCPAIALST